MPLVLLSIDRAAFMATHTRKQDDPAIAIAIAKLWAPYDAGGEKESALECFTCGEPDIQPRAELFSMVLPEYNPRYVSTRLIVASLCSRCRDIQPPTRRFALCLKILKRMAKARDPHGKGVAFAHIQHNPPHPT